MQHYFSQKDEKIYKDLTKSISINQLSAKIWLYRELTKHISGIPVVGTSEHNYQKNNYYLIEVIGSWFGFPLIETLERSFNAYYARHSGARKPMRNYVLYDLDQENHRVAEMYSRMYKEYSNNNVDFHLTYKGDFFQNQNGRHVSLIVNTSQEHMPYIDNYFIKNEPLVVVQSNNMVDIDEHTNCVRDEFELAKNLNISKILFGGHLPFLNPYTLKDLYSEDESIKYERYMVIGKW